MADDDLDGLFAAPDSPPSDAEEDLLRGFGLSPLTVRDVVLDPTFGKRRDTLLRSVPVHDLVDRAARAGSGLEPFDVRALVLAAFDAVIARQGFPERTTAGQVITLLAEIAAIQVPDSTPKARRDVAEHVLDELTNRRGRARQFTLPTMMYAEDRDGKLVATEVKRPFWLLREAEDARSGIAHLEASADAINALVGGLDIPIEDQQTALETVLERQLDRGELDAAYVTAMQARKLSSGYLIQVEELLAETERYLPGTDWATTAPGLLRTALDHLTECLEREGRLLGHVAGAADRAGSEPSDPGAEKTVRISAAMTKMLSESRHIHTLLLERLLGARGRFLDAQDDQMFRPITHNVEFDLTDDLLSPALALHLVDAEKVADAYLGSVMGPVSPVVLNWGDFVDALISPRTPPAEPEDAEEPSDLEFRPDPLPLVDAQLLDTAHRALARVQLPARLSTLIAAAAPSEGLGAAAGDLFVAAALRAFDNSSRDHEDSPAHGSWMDDPDPATAPGPPGRRAPRGRTVHLLDVLGVDCACLSDGVTLPAAGWSGDDLIVCADRDQADAVLLEELPRPSPTSLPPRLRGAAS